MRYIKKSTQFLLIFLLIIICSSINSEAIGYPKAITLPAENISSTSATLKGSVNPNGIETNTYFVSASTPSTPPYFSQTPTQTISAGDSPIVINQDLTGLRPGITYSYKIIATNSAGDYIGAVINFTTPISPPSAPQKLKAIASGSSISLSWDIPNDFGGSDITNYKIYRDTTSGANTLLITVSSLSTTYIDSSGSSGQTYYYKVSAVNSVGEGAMSNEASASLPLIAVTTPQPSITTPQPATTTPTPTLIVTITSKPASVIIGQKSEIMITVTADDKEVSGASVMLGSSKEGMLDPTSVTTDFFGQVSSDFTGTAAGKAAVRAIVRKAGFEQGNGDIQIEVLTSMPTPITPKQAMINNKVNTSEYIGSTVTADENKTPSKSLGEPEGSDVFNFSSILIVLTSAGIIYLIYWKWNMKSKEEKAQRESVIKLRRCSNCGMEAPGDDNFCEKCGKPLGR